MPKKPTLIELIIKHCMVTRCYCCDKDISDDDTRIVSEDDRASCEECYEDLLPWEQEDFTEGR